MKLRARGETAFSLLEIMIAVSIFFMAVFAILGLMSRSLAQARGLQPMRVDAASVAAELSLTNRLEEGPIPDEIIKHFEHMYPNYTCGGFITEVGTNGLFQVDFDVGGITAGKKVVTSQSRILLFRPMSQSSQRMPTRPGLR
jgi:Tfp pilus assembly protein PilV